MFVRYARMVGMGIFISLLFSACGPPWPLCKKDGDCHSKRSGNRTGRQLFCIQKQCRECRTIADCPQQKFRKCQGYQCVRKTCADITCPGIKRCQPKTLRCEWICEKDGDVPCDGNRCKTCKKHLCIYRQPGCLTSADCPGDEVCQNANTCMAACGAGCDLLKCRHPYECYRGSCLELCKFKDIDFKANKADIEPKAQVILQALILCLQLRKTKKLLIKAHYTERKTREFNIHKSLERAYSVIKYLQKQKISANRLCPVARGQEELLFSGKSNKKKRAKNRRVAFGLVDHCP